MTDFDIKQAVASIAPELTRIREHLHRNPEIGNAEFDTADFIIAELNTLGIEIRRPVGTSIVGVLRGTGNPNNSGAEPRKIGLRADMDALPVTETTGAVFASERNGMMHACGHDVHMTGALGTAMVLSAHRDSFAGEVHFLFQPDEEGEGGADRMIAAGAVEGLDAVYGAHVDPSIPLGKVGVKYGKFYAASDEFAIEIEGVSTHGAQPENGIDPIRTATSLLAQLYALPDTVQDRCVLTIGKISAGTVRNVIPATAELSGILRTLGAETRAHIKQQIVDTASTVSAKTGAKITVKFFESYAGVVNTDPETELAETACASVLGPESAVRIAEPTMTTEDVGAFINAVSGSFYHVGVGGNHPLHSSDFLPDQSACEIATIAHTAVLLRALSA